MKKGSLVREWSLWNQLNLGLNRYSSDSSSSQPRSLDIESVTTVDEKATLLANDNVQFLKEQESKSKFKKWKILRNSALALLAVGLVSHYKMDCHSDMELNEPKNYGSILNNNDEVFVHHGSPSVYDYEVSDSIDDEEKEVVPPVHEVIEVGLPLLSYGPTVYNQSLLNYTFGNSWGHPAIVDYVAPPSNITFNQVVITLNTWVDGVQYDRLAHLYLDGSEIWRTSTIEPSGNLSHSFAQKDLSIYAKLFEKDTTLIFQLDNLITPRLTGAFNISLNALYFNSTPGFSLLPKDPAETDSNKEFLIQDIDDEIIPGALDTVFSSREAADQVFPLVKTDIPSRPPLVYIPDKDFTAPLPKLNTNTTKVKLELFVSGNAEEEFWWSNVLDEFTPVFEKHGHKLGGHGPCRVVNVFSNGYRIASANPYPVIFTGGVSPPLWNPIVSSGAFDLRALEVDLTSLLPLFWDDEENDITVEITNCIDDDDKLVGPPSGIGNNWITSANIVAWENELIADGTGEILAFDNSTKISSFGFAPPMIGMLQQIVRAEYTNKVNSTLYYTLLNGTTYNYTAESYNEAKQMSMINMKKFGDSQTILSVPESKHSFAVLDYITNETLSTLNYTHRYALTSKLETQPLIPGSGELSYGVNITRDIDIKVGIDGLTAVKLTSKENGTSNFTLSPNGNHGFGSSEHNLTITESAPLENATYNRHALGVNGTIIYDNVTFTEPEAEEDSILESPLNFASLEEHFTTEHDEYLEMIKELFLDAQSVGLEDLVLEVFKSNYDSLTGKPEVHPIDLDEDGEVIEKPNLFQGHFMDFY